MTTTAPLDVFLPLYQQFQQMIQASEAKTDARIKELEEQLSQWVDTKTALQMTGIKSAEWLKELRERPESLIVFKREGKLVKYLRTSLIAYSKANVRRPHVGRALAA